MALEIERKFLVNGDGWRRLGTGTLYRQGYVPTLNGTVRVRIAGEQGYLTLKTPTVGISRREFEYPIPLTDADELLDLLCDRPIIEKTRYRIMVGTLLWEVDEFAGENQGLILAEVELVEEEQAIELPDWIGEEVSGDRRYFNSCLAQHPFTKWE